MTDLQTPTAEAYLSWGKWLADCPRCTDARAVYPEDKQTGRPAATRHLDQHCAYGHHFRILIPPPEEEARIVAEMVKRPPPERFWWPSGHPMRPPEPDDTPVDQSEEDTADA